MSAVDLIVDLPPPDSHVELEGLRDLSPSAFIQHPDILKLLRRMTSLPIGPETQKNCRLEPPPIQDDCTILDYYDRVYRSVYKEEISIRIPGDGFIITMNNNGEVNLIHFDDV